MSEEEFKYYTNKISELHDKAGVIDVENGDKFDNIANLAKLLEEREMIIRDIENSYPELIKRYRVEQSMELDDIELPKIYLLLHDFVIAVKEEKYELCSNIKNNALNL